MNENKQIDDILNNSKYISIPLVGNKYKKNQQKIKNIKIIRYS